MLQTTIIQIQSEEIQHVIDDFCEMLRWGKTEYFEHPLHNFLELVFMQDPSLITLLQIPVPRVLDRKIGKLQDHDFYPICKALKNGDVLEQHSNFSLLTFLKRHYLALQKPPKKRRRR